MVNPPIVPRGLYRTGDSNDAEVCVDFGNGQKILSYYSYWNASYLPYFSDLPEKNDYLKYKNVHVFKYNDILDYYNYIDMAKKSIIKAKKDLDERGPFLERLRDLDYDDYLSAVDVDVFEHRLKLRVDEYNTLKRYLNTHWNYAVFPNSDWKEGIYYVDPAEAKNLAIETLYIPEGGTLCPKAGVTEINWAVKNLKFGHNSTFDLSAPDVEPITPGDWSDLPPAPEGLPGLPGREGVKGRPGTPGVSLTLRGVENIGGGSLWIKTDGRPGGPGGRGGNGQAGGERERKLWGRRAQSGGQGGKGGQGGDGGWTSSINISFRTGDNPFRLLSEVTNPGTSNRPDIKESLIRIYGAPGRGGSGGSGGEPGKGSSTNIPGETGSSGAPGRAGSAVFSRDLGD
ncbi:hypothetical protein J2W42_001128 [Rhizobium tibeticum]|uniref:collagen-like triple helix repeat-containing protein n=1 Tax=Rhizobium tibeticum TaxID=501024 RepID=UPI002785CA23|nr:collagen-like protein [Rhizobium tibeticum]MDP9808290.1 hypothetical protein [Rhizobium tibeticum]